MNDSSGIENNDGTGASPSEVDLLVYKLFGKPAAHVSPPTADARAEREHLEWLATFSPRHERELLAARLRDAEERAALELQEFVNAIRGVDEAAWDPARHPRTGAPPNRGWWASTGGWEARGDALRGQRSPASDVGGEYRVKTQFASQRSDGAKQPDHAAPEKKARFVPPPNFHHHGDRTHEQEERFHKLLDELADDHETLAGSLARAAKKKTQFHVYWTDRPTHSTRGGPGGSKTGERLGIHVNKNRPEYVPDAKHVELDDVDPDKAAKIVIGHELGHTILKLEDPTEQNPAGGNVTLVENPLRKRLGVKQRQRYNGLQVPDPLGSGNQDFLRAKKHQDDERRNEHNGKK